MFFVGAFSGNFLYLILVISYLAGFSALAMKSPDDQTKALKTSEVTSAHTLYNTTFNEHSFLYSTIHTFHTDQALSEGHSFGPAVIHYWKVPFISPHLTPKSIYSGFALFSRPPPYLLV